MFFSRAPLFSRSKHEVLARSVCLFAFGARIVCGKRSPISLAFNFASSLISPNSQSHHLVVPKTATIMGTATKRSACAILDTLVIRVGKQQAVQTIAVSKGFATRMSANAILVRVIIHAWTTPHHVIQGSWVPTAAYQCVLINALDTVHVDQMDCVFAMPFIAGKIVLFSHVPLIATSMCVIPPSMYFLHSFFPKGECVSGMCRCYPGYSGFDCVVKDCYPACSHGQCDPLGSGSVFIDIYIPIDFHL